MTFFEAVDAIHAMIPDYDEVFSPTQVRDFAYQVAMEEATMEEVVALAVALRETLG